MRETFREAWATLKRCPRGEFLPECISIALALFVILYTLTTGI